MANIPGNMDNDHEAANEGLVIQPYRFEPIVNVQDTGSDSDLSIGDPVIPDINPERVGNTAWCKCGFCVVMPTGRESVCCLENQRIIDRLSGMGLACFTLHEGFQGNCLNRYVLEVSLYAYVEDVLPIDDNELPHETYRYIAYRNFTRFVYKRLRKHERKVIPSCCVTKIRNTFPSEQYCGFKYALPQ